jgi:hypothetical protein
MEKINKKMKLQIILIIIISNVLVYLTFSGGEGPQQQLKESHTSYREGFVRLKLEGQLHTDFEYNKPISIINKKRTIVIKHAIMLQHNDDSSMREETLLIPGTAKRDRISIYVHKRHVSALIAMHTPIIVPYNSVSPIRSKRVNYEILL